MFNKLNHKILKVLFLHYRDGAEKTSSASQVTELGRSYDIQELLKNLKRNKNIRQVEEACQYLFNEGYLRHPDGNDNKYLVTPMGQSAYLEKKFLNKLWYRKPQYWITGILAPVLTALLLYLLNN
jgi:hypothetical protein